MTVNAIDKLFNGLSVKELEEIILRKIENERRKIETRLDLKRVPKPEKKSLRRIFR